jgi:hypothetical protein
MPLSINVGLSRKASKDYQSTGYSINVTAELDQTLLAKPDELQKQIADLYAQAREALDGQAGTAPAAPPDRQNRRPPQRNGYHGRNGSDSASGNGHARSGGNGQMTASQRRAITAIAERAGVDPNREAIDIAGNELDSLTLREASELIDHLKDLAPASGGR